jgi:L-ascorbate metabolism protein UlaG (beta-lactamase superfamily)
MAARPDFDEKAWRSKVEAQKTADLYTPHEKNGTFFNPWMTMEKKGFFTLLRWKLSAGQNYTDEEKQFMPSLVPDPLKIVRGRTGDFIMWVGHATFLIRLGNDLWLTDPMFSERALLPRREIPPAISIDDLKGIACSRLNVVISHNHYDHLDSASIEQLPANTRFFVPLGLKKFLTDLGKTDIVEMDWWQTQELSDGSKIVCLPAQHWSRRIGQGMNSTLWASFILAGPAPRKTIYFGGDSGYFIGFSEIGKKYRGIDYALVPITAYNPRWFMHYAHMDIDESLDAFKELGARYFIPTQWGVFHLGDEPPGFPVIELRKKIAERKLDPSQFLIMDIGQAIFLN